MKRKLIFMIMLPIWILVGFTAFYYVYQAEPDMKLVQMQETDESSGSNASLSAPSTPAVKVLQQKDSIENAQNSQENVPVTEENAPVSYHFTVQTVSNRLHVRATPSADGTHLSYLNSGDTGDAFEPEGDWTYIKSGELEGYVNTKYLILEEE